MNGKHTPGPWMVGSRVGDDWDSVVYIPDTPNEICQCFHDPDNTEECSANARLIAAAPDLLAACEEFVRKCECGEAKSKRSYTQMKVAVSKATSR